jgi:hypothetical protein
MLRVKLGSNEVEVRFDHNVCDPSKIKKTTGICVDGDRRCTLATVNLNGKTICKGMAICHQIDNFNKSTGRKIAMTYGLHSLTKELRTAVWEEYKAKMGY